MTRFLYGLLCSVSLAFKRCVAVVAMLFMPYKCLAENRHQPMLWWYESFAAMLNDRRLSYIGICGVALQPSTRKAQPHARHTPKTDTIPPNEWRNTNEAWTSELYVRVYSLIQVCREPLTRYERAEILHFSDQSGSSTSPKVLVLILFLIATQCTNDQPKSQKSRV